MMRAIEAALERRGLAYQSMNAPDFRHFDLKRPGSSSRRCTAPRGWSSAASSSPACSRCRCATSVRTTRSTGELVLSAHGPSGVVTRVRQALEQVLRHFSRMPA
jgi:hypothetical protein